MLTNSVTLSLTCVCELRKAVQLHYSRCITHFWMQSWQNYVCRSLRCSVWNAESLRASNIAQVHTRSNFRWRMKDPVPDLQRFLSEVSKLQLAYKSWAFVHSRTSAGELLFLFLLLFVSLCVCMCVCVCAFVHVCVCVWVCVCFGKICTVQE